MNINEIDKSLTDHGVRPSPIRVLVARTISESTRPLSANEIEERLETVDRSSITRSLALFYEKGAVHAIDDGSGSIKYEWCHNPHSDIEIHPHNDLHPHFHCVTCGKTFCLYDAEIPPVALPEGFTAESVNYVIKGRCPECN